MWDCYIYPPVAISVCATLQQCILLGSFLFYCLQVQQLQDQLAATAQAERTGKAALEEVCLLYVTVAGHACNLA